MIIVLRRRSKYITADEQLQSQCRTQGYDAIIIIILLGLARLGALSVTPRCGIYHQANTFMDAISKC